MIGIVIILALVILAGIAMLASSLRSYYHYTHDSAGNELSWPEFDSILSNIDSWDHSAEHKRKAAEIRREAPRPPLVALSAVILITTTSIALGLVLFFDEAAIIDISAAGATWTSAGVTNVVVGAILAALIYGVVMGALMRGTGTSAGYPFLVGLGCAGMFWVMTSGPVVATSAGVMAIFLAEVALAFAWVGLGMVPATLITLFD